MNEEKNMENREVVQIIVENLDDLYETSKIMWDPDIFWSMNKTTLDDSYKLLLETVKLFEKLKMDYEEDGE